MGLLLKVVVHPANIPDAEGARRLLAGVTARFPRLKQIWADAAYRGELLDWAKERLGLTIEVVKRPDAAFGFEVLPRRWVVERSFAWFGRNRGLSKDYEFLSKSHESMVYLASIRLLLKRAASPANLPLAL